MTTGVESRGRTDLTWYVQSKQNDRRNDLRPSRISVYCVVKCNPEPNELPLNLPHAMKTPTIVVFTEFHEPDPTKAKMKVRPEDEASSVRGKDQINTVQSWPRKGACRHILGSIPSPLASYAQPMYIRSTCS